MQTTHRLPGFADNKPGRVYACEVFDLSAAFRQEITEHSIWWPTVREHLRTSRPDAVFRLTLALPDKEPRHEASARAGMPSVSPDEPGVPLSPR